MKESEKECCQRTGLPIKCRSRPRSATTRPAPHHKHPLIEKGLLIASTNSKRNGWIPAVLYLRMSSARQDKSISAQRVELRAYAKKRGYEIVDEYLDEARSGGARRFDQSSRVGSIRDRSSTASETRGSTSRGETER